MERHFVQGPYPAWNWRGRCIWDSLAETYTHDTEWPVRSTTTWPLTAQKLQELLDQKLWTEVIADPDLNLDEGL